MRNRPLVPLILWFGFWSVAFGGCESKAPTPNAHAHHEHADHQAVPTRPDAKPNEPTGPRIETGSFLLEVASTQPEYEVGKAGEVEIEIEGRGEWHVNQDYPIRVDLAAGPGAGLQQRELVRGDAKEFNEDKVRFVAALEPTEAGDHEVKCDVSFAMCTDENCVLEKRTVAMQVKVE
ncbi:MAG: hypothetical protein OEM15_11430 [Myxococcales bacterium]|nr:hypothetical protein [Myxococcales bacterium]MDH3483435.1 hypothetical protein [Myxococcales bacterium]